MVPQRVLVAEDEMIIGVDLCDTVAEAGFQVDGPFHTARSAIDAVRRSRPDLAILDVHLDDGEVYPLADALLAENVPVIFHSSEVPSPTVNCRYPAAVALSKPCPPNQIIETVREVLSAG